MFFFDMHIDVQKHTDMLALRDFLYSISPLLQYLHQKIEGVIGSVFT